MADLGLSFAVGVVAYIPITVALAKNLNPRRFAITVFSSGAAFCVALLALGLANV